MRKYPFIPQVQYSWQMVSGTPCYKDETNVFVNSRVLQVVPRKRDIIIMDCGNDRGNGMKKRKRKKI